MKRCVQLLLIAGLSLFAASSASAQGGIISGIAWRYTPAGAFPAGSATITICTAGATGQPCTPTVSLFSDSGLTMPVANPLAQCTVSPQVGCIDNLGNFTAFATAGLYTYTQTGVGLQPYGPIPIAASNSGGSIGGTIANTQIGFGTASNTLGSSANLIWDNVNNTVTVKNPNATDGWVLANLTPATNTVAQSSPVFRLRGQSWNGSTSVNNDWTIQNVTLNGTNAGQILRIAPSLSLGAIDMSTVSVTTGQLISGNHLVGGVVELTAAAATVGGNVNSSPYRLDSTYWNGAASITSTTSIQDIEGTGTTPTNTTTISNSGAFNWAGISLLGAFKSSVSVSAPTFFAGTDNSVAGVFQASNSAANAHTIWGSAATTSNTILGPATAPQTDHILGCTTSSTTCTLTDFGIIGAQCGAVTAGGTCGNTVTATEHCISGTAALSGGTSTITAISPAFTSSTSFTVVTNDNTTITNASKGVPASASSITFTGTGTDVLNFIACGG